MPTELSPGSRYVWIASIAACSIIATIVGVDSTAASVGSRWLARSSSATVLASVPFVPTGIGFIDRLLRALCGSALETYGIELLYDPFDAVVTPERLAIDDKCRHAENAVAVASGERILELARPLIERVALEPVRVEANFFHHRGERVAVFDVEFALEEALEHGIAVLAKYPVTVSPQARHQRQLGVEDFLRPADDDPARVGVAAGVEVEVADFAPIALGTLIEIAAIRSANIQLTRDVVQADAMRFDQRVRRRHRKIRERTLVVVVELDGQGSFGHAITVVLDLALRGKENLTSNPFLQR